MRKFIIDMNNKKQTILAQNKKEAVTMAKVALGFKSGDSLCSFSKELYNGIEDLVERCQRVEPDPEVVSLWKPVNLPGESPRGWYIDILKENGYTDNIHFEVGQEDLAQAVYDMLSKYNRDYTPLEVFHARCMTR